MVVLKQVGELCFVRVSLLCKFVGDAGDDLKDDYGD
jgi:hypothetical protein